jgi:hypothetical protein
MMGRERGRRIDVAARGLVLATLWLTLLSGVARAAPAAAPAAGETEERPWAVGVSPERQKVALERLQEGNALVKESLFLQAAEKYREALAIWDHPGIHYNLALALLSLDQPLEVHQQLESALRYGIAPLDKDKFDHARSYLMLIEKQLASIDVRCEVAGATVSLDGRVLFQAPGRYQSLVRPGPHTVTAAKDGFPTTERTKVLIPGEPSLFQLKLYAAGELIGYRRRFPAWQPVSVTVAGGVLLAAGVLLTLEAKSRYDAFDQQLKAQCNIGCVPDPSLAAIRNRGDTYQTLATISFAVGAAAVVGGIWLLYLNTPVPYRIEPAERQTSISLLPVLDAHGAGMVGLARF